MTIIFSHIPKCGGTSFRHSLDKAYGSRAKFYYFNPTRHRLKDRLEFHAIRAKRRLLSQYIDADQYDIIYGHFCFDDIIPRAEDYKLGLFLREPIDWLGSFLHYHWAKYPGEFSDDPIEVITKLKLDRFFGAYLGRYSIDDMDFIGISEYYDKSLSLFGKMYSVDVVEFSENKTKDRPKDYADYFATKGVLDEVKNLMSQNIEIYQQGMILFENKLEQSGLTLRG